MGFNGSGVYTAPTGATNANPGDLIKSVTWNSIFTDLSSALTTLGQQAFGTTPATGSILSSSASGGIGYSTGAGGTITQATNKSTTVILNKLSGAITMNAAALGPATIVSFTLTNSSIAATDIIVADHISGGTTGAYTINGRATGPGTAAFDIRNNTAGSLSEAIVIQFAVIKGVNA